MTKLKLKSIILILSIIRPLRKSLNNLDFYLIDLTDKII